MVFGARAKLTLYVIDTKGNPVPDANVLGWFWQGGGEHNKRVDVHTDEKGFCVLEGKTMSHIRFYVSKEEFMIRIGNSILLREIMTALKEDGGFRGILPWKLC